MQTVKEEMLKKKKNNTDFSNFCFALYLDVVQFTFNEKLEDIEWRTMSVDFLVSSHKWKKH